ncbi:hypothetical protein HR060_18495 [Catenovulum sp. SM1970]|uniref:IucA/IucC family protein n=1 Tax=Marinifaba aquimaris TaxID=2741323 RepID=UPI00157496CC|nr:IucA/IucC family protein [Marinifaba aquimaris]NTS78835.1 hypothetical protein [Marinifaba aquimaris]
MLPLDLAKGEALNRASFINTDTQSINPTTRVIKQLLEAVLYEHVCEKTYKDGYFFFELNQRQYKAKGRYSSFGRVRLDSQQMAFKKEMIWQTVDLEELIEDLPTNDIVKAKLHSELMQTIKLCQWNHAKITKPNRRTQLGYSQLESLIDEGHPYHPCFKARTGFSLNDHQNYGPEYQNTFQLDWIAIRSNLMRANLPVNNEVEFWQNELGEKTYQVLQNRLVEQTGQTEGFSLLPIHPWQWQNLQSELNVLVQNGQLAYLGAAGDQYQASISVRTLLNVTHPEKANIKLPLNMVNTSSLRSIDSHSICSAPVLSNWLNNLVKDDEFFSQNAVLLDEYAGITFDYDKTQDAPCFHKLDGQIGVIFRQSIHSLIDENRVVPFVALTVLEADGKPFIEPWIKQYGCEKWLQQLIETTIIPVWHLLVNHGIAIEAHGQNMLFSHQNGWPEKAVLRDFHESLEYVDSYLAQPALTPNFKELDSRYQNANPDQYYWMQNVEALRELVIDTLFVFNLADLSLLLEEYYQYPEQAFWQLVHQCFNHYQESGLTNKDRIEQVDIYQPYIKTESLLMKKFSDEPDAEFHHNVVNPLAQVSASSTSANTPNQFETSVC